MFLIVGLGNPGDEYVNTRHNIGFDVIDGYAKRHGIKLNKLKFNSIYGEARINGKKAMLVKPTTYMNRSGLALGEISSYYRIPTNKIIVVADDIDIPFSSIRIKRNGSGGSHNGLKSIVSSLNSKDFPRIKIGVGKKREKQDLASFVLSKFTREERVYLDESVVYAMDAIDEFLKEGIDSSMNRYNNKMSKPEDE